MSESTTPVDETGETMTTEQPSNNRQPRLSVRLFGLALIIFSIVVATYLVVAYFAFESGRSLREEQEITSRVEQIEHQIALAQEDVAQGSENLALTRLEWVLAQDPANAEAIVLREQINAAAAAEPVATPTAEPEEAEPEPETVQAISDEDALPELRSIRRLVAGEQWEDALSALLAFRQLYPDYERAETDQLLYDTYVALGLEYVNSDKIELGLNYFSQAERLGNLPQEALDYRVWADLYFEGIAYSGVNWDIAAGYWRDLCAAAPFFKDSCARLDGALEGYGDQLAYLMDWCPAISVYQEAWNRRPSEMLESKIAQAREGCASATPITNTVPLTGTAPITDTPPLEPGG